MYYSLDFYLSKDFTKSELNSCVTIYGQSLEELAEKFNMYFCRQTDISGMSLYEYGDNGCKGIKLVATIDEMKKFFENRGVIIG